MSSNTDNQMTRFLFAILKQKNLKDIDWNAVAHDPILSRPITNGHAARMRYFRFRSRMLDIETSKQNRVAVNKVTRSKKKPKPKKEKEPGPKTEEDSNNDCVRPESDTTSTASCARSTVLVKQELANPPSYQQQFRSTWRATVLSQ